MIWSEGWECYKWKPWGCLNQSSGSSVCLSWLCLWFSIFHVPFWGHLGVFWTMLGNICLGLHSSVGRSKSWALSLSSLQGDLYTTLGRCWRLRSAPCPPLKSQGCPSTECKSVVRVWNLWNLGVKFSFIPNLIYSFAMI